MKSKGAILRQLVEKGPIMMPGVPNAAEELTLAAIDGDRPEPPQNE